ncbi:MAG: hypothetical protein P8Q95_02810 [Candidatus Poseidoniaceae archaeon]|nr:hypothetical protein [Candidatus Poseidoniaceae archaeon]
MWGDESVSLVPVEWLKTHEEIRVRARDKLLDMTKRWGGFTKPLVVDKKTGSLLDGHHRYSVACLLNLTSVPAICVDYLFDETIIVETWPNSDYEEITKKDVVDMCLSDDLFPPKTSRHMFAYDIPPIFISLDALR